MEERRCGMMVGSVFVVTCERCGREAVGEEEFDIRCATAGWDYTRTGGWVCDKCKEREGGAE